MFQHQQIRGLQSVAQLLGIGLAIGVTLGHIEGMVAAFIFKQFVDAATGGRRRCFASVEPGKALRSG